jgi:ubiquinol-cytochrome c reductase cytochrome b subunit
LITWIEQRTGIVSQINEFLTEDVPGGASYWYVFGSATLFAMICQFVTGIFLTFYYAPSADTAWESTNYIYKNVPLGWFVISLHYWGATAMIALVALHLLQVLIWGAYKAPRELSWVIGVLLFLVTLVLGLTGYLLPWDMNAYFASQVAVSIAQSTPVVGGIVQQFAYGGPSMGTLTINRFFGLHVWLMPALLALLVVAHLLVFRHNGGAGPPTDAELKRLPQGRFWPNQMFMDAVASFGVFVIIVALAILSPAPLDVKADPTKAFIPYPAWYFLALYGLLRVPGIFNLSGGALYAANLLATIVLPGVLVTVLLLLPFIDRNPSRRISKRPWVLGITALTLIGAIGLSVFSQVAIMEEAAASPAVPAAAAAPPAGGTAVAAADNPKGAAVYSQNCAGCHGAAGAGVPGAFPPLAGSEIVKGDTTKLIHILNYGLNGSVSVEGKTYNGQMPAWKGNLTNDQIADVINYIRNSWGNKGSNVTPADVAKVAK